MSKILKNISSSVILQIGNYLLPMISLPIVVRIIGAEKFGLINYSAAVIGYFVVFINFGFDFTATRRIALTKNKKEIADIFNKVIFSKLVLFLVSSFVFIALICFSNDIRENLLLYVVTYLITFSSVITPTWLYQGTQNLFKNAVFSVIAKLIFTITTILVIRDQKQFYFQPLILSVSQLLVGLFSFIHAIRFYSLKISVPSLGDIIKELLDNRSIFLSTIVPTLYTLTNTIILATFCGVEAVGYYTASHKFIAIMQSIIIIPLGQTFFPFISQQLRDNFQSAVTILNKTFPLILTFFIIVSICLFAGSSLIIDFFYGHEFTESINLLRFMSGILILIALNNFFGLQIMVNLKMDKYYFYFNLTVLLFSICCSLIMVHFFKIWGVAFSWFLSELLLFLCCLVFLIKRDIVQPSLLFTKSLYSKQFYQDTIQLLKK